MLPPEVSLADELSEILQLSQDSAYRRMRGETDMSIDEAIKLCTHYKIPITHFVDEIPGLVNFKYIPPENKQENFRKHLEMILSTMDVLLGHEDRHILYAAIDAPLFHQFGHKELALFKMHFRMNVIPGIEDFKSDYDEDDVDREFLNITNRIYENYLEIPSDEICEAINSMWVTRQCRRIRHLIYIRAMYCPGIIRSLQLQTRKKPLTSAI